MGYVAIRGGETAIREAARALEFLRAQGGGAPLEVDAIRDKLHFLTGRVIGEGGLYDPDLAALALKQAAGDPLEAAFFLRAFRSTRARLAVTDAHDGTGMRLVRRISSAFKDIPGGQMLGPTPDYLQRLFRFEQLAEGSQAFQELARNWRQDLPSPDLPDSFPKVVDALRSQGLLPTPTETTAPAFDITRDPLVFPVSRSAALATMSRAETGSMLAIAYSNMRGYGDVHPTVAELRVGYVPLMLPHPLTGEPVEAGEVLVTECEVVACTCPPTNPVPGRCSRSATAPASGTTRSRRSRWRSSTGPCRRAWRARPTTPAKTRSSCCCTSTAWIRWAFAPTTRCRTT